MKKSKRIFAFLLSAIMLLGVLPISAFAQDPLCTLTLDSVSATAGTTVDVSVNISNNPGILNATLSLVYDDDSLELVEVASGPAFEEMSFTKPEKNENGCKLVWSAASVKEAKDGEILTLTFKVSENAKTDRTFPISLTYNEQDITGTQNTPVSLKTVAGSIFVPSYLPGDATDDDIINALDLESLSQYISDGRITDPDGYNSKVNAAASDVNNDGKLNALDLILTSRYITDGCVTDPDGYDVTLIPSTKLCPESEFKLDKLTIGGVDISEFRIIRGANMSSVETKLCSYVQQAIYDLCGVEIPYTSYTSAETEYEILFGDTRREETSKEVAEGEINIEQTENKLAFYGNGDYSAAYAIKYFITEILDEIPECNTYDISLDDVIGLEYTLPTLTATNLPLVLEDHTDTYSTDFTSNDNVLEKFFSTVDELPSEISVLEPIEAKDYPISLENQIYVAPDGDDENPGTIDKPMATINAAAQKLNNLFGGVIWVRGGLYELSKANSLSISGTLLSPVIIAAYGDETPIFTSAKDIPASQFKSVDYTKDSVAQRISKEAQENIVYVNLLELGWTEEDIGTIGGANTPKLYIDGELQSLARYPNENEPELYFDYVFDTGSVSSSSEHTNLYAGWIERVKSGEFDNIEGIEFYTDSVGNRNCNWGWVIKMNDLTPCTWENTGNIWYYGNVFEGWEFGHYNIESFDVLSKKMTSKSGSSYGAKHSTNSPTGYNNYYLYNAIEARDAPGEWFYDPDTGNFYIYKTDGFENSSVRYSVADFSIFKINNARCLVIDGLFVETSGGKGFEVTGSDNVIIQRCNIKNTQSYAISVASSSKSCAVIYNDISSTGATMIYVYPGSNSVYNLSRDRNVIQNNYLHDPRANVQGGISIGGHLSVVSHNYLDNCQISFSTSAECIVEYNELSGGSKDVSDAGLIYLVGYYHHGNHIRYNYMHSWNAPGSGVYFDDLSSGNYAYYNIIDSTEGTRGKGINMLYTSSGHYNVFYGNILLGRPNDYIHESCLYFDSSSSLGYRFKDRVTSFLSTSTKYKDEFYKRFPEYSSFIEKMNTHAAERDEEGYERNELEIYLRSPDNNIIMNNVILGCSKPIYQPILEKTNSVTGNPMVSGDYIKNNYIGSTPSAILTDYKNGDFTVLPDKLAEIKETIPDFVQLSTSNAGPTVEISIAEKHKVQFVDAEQFGGGILSQAQVAHGKSAKAPLAPYHEGYVFTGWDVEDYSCITSDMVITATYREEEEDTEPETGNTIEEYKSLYVSDGSVLHLNFAGATPQSAAIVGSSSYQNSNTSASNRFNGAASNYTPYLFNSTVSDPVSGGTAKILTPWYFEDWYADWTSALGTGKLADMRTIEPTEYANTTTVDGSTVYIVNTYVNESAFYIQNGKWAKKTYASVWGDGYLTLGANSTLNFSNVQSQVKNGKGYTMQFVASRVGTGKWTAFTGMRLTISGSTSVKVEYNSAYKYISASSTFAPIEFAGISINVPNTYTIAFDREDTAAVDISVYLNAIDGGTQTVAENSTIDSIFKLFEGADSNIYAIRLYNRVLTDAEIAQNYFADLVTIAKLDITEFLKLDAAEKATVYTALSEYTSDIPASLLQKALDDAVKAAEQSAQ